MRKRIFAYLFSVVMMISLVVTNPTRLIADGAEWYSVSKNEGTVTEAIDEGIRYYDLSSTTKNGNNDNAAIFARTTEWVMNGKEGNTIFEFMPQSGKNRFAVFLYYTDEANYLSVGYDIGGWFWEYKIDGVGDYMKTTRIPAPAVNSKNTLEISLKDNKLLAWNTSDAGERDMLFDKMVDVDVIDQLSEKSQSINIKLGTYGSELSSVRIKAVDQENIIIPDPGFERPVLDIYDPYDLVVDFEALTDQELKDMFTVQTGDIETSIVDIDGNKQMKIDFKSTGRQLLSFRETPLLENFEMSFDMKFDAVMKRFGPMFRNEDATSFAYAAIGDAMNQYFTEHYGVNSSYSSTTTATQLEPEETYRWKVRVEGKVISLFIDDIKILENEMTNTQTGLGAFGFVKDRGVATVYLDNIHVTKLVPERPEDPNNEGVITNTLQTGSMTVEIDEGFPRILSYTMTSGDIMMGQPTKIDTIRINDVDIVPTVSFTRVSDTQADYILDVVDASASINATLKAVLTVKDHTVRFTITEIVNHNEDQTSNAQIIRTIEIPNHSLVSVQSDQANANIVGTVMSTNTTVNGDTLTYVDASTRNFAANYMYGIVSNDTLSASIYSNTQYSAGGGNRDFTRINARAKEFKESVSVGLSSTPWIYHRDVMYGDDTLELPEVKVVITGDANNDNVVDWQDGAIAYRNIMYSPIGAENVKDLVAYRIAMNFGSHAQNPFLMTLDGIKKINLHTDGLGQSILLKGYGSEGHDSGHLDYANIGERMGGLEEFRQLLDASKAYGAEIGIHINASETYPESKYFGENILRKNADGSYNYGWNWIDQGINIDASYDLANRRRLRFEELKEAVGDRLDWIYVDVWGNGQSGDNNAWASHQLAKEIHDQGWRLGGEWGYAFEPDSTFQHWAADLTYGGYSLKGVNSNVSRFIYNQQRDSWVGNYPSYSGAADYPLLGGYDMKDFEGWQGRNNYDGYIENLFKTNVPTKFLQHYEVNRWVNGDAVSMTNPDGKPISWVPEMEISLVNEQGDRVVVTRKSNDYANDIANYRSRTMTLNGRLVLDGGTYLLPWNWDENGNPLTGNDEKLYHFNTQGGTSTWAIPSDWNVSDVVVYKLTETGKEYIDTVSVIDGAITLDATASTPYSIYKGEQAQETVTYGEGAHIVDPGFNTQNLDVWSVTGDGASVVKSQASNDMLAITGNTTETRVSQVLTDLTPGQNYVAYVGVDNRSDVKASISVSFGDTVVENYTLRSIAKNYVKAYAHNTNSSTVNGNSYFQNMFVYFTAPDSGEVTLTLARDASDQATYFDDVRITENEGNTHINNTTFFQDFENSAQGIYPFVVGNIEGVEDNRTHLSELHAPFTQRGWNQKQISDVIDGKWSLKTNGLTQRNRLVYQTIPQNIRFEPNQKYKITFDYEAGSEGTYALIVGDGEMGQGEVKTPLNATLFDEGAKTYEFEIVASPTGQTWFGIFSTSTAPNLQGSADKEANFRSYKDIMLDNVRVERIESVDTVELKDNVTNVILSGSADLLKTTDTFSAPFDETLKATLETNHEGMDVDVFTLNVQREDQALTLPEGRSVEVMVPVRTTLRSLETVNGVYQQTENGDLVPLTFTVDAGMMRAPISSFAPIVVNYGIDTVDKTALNDAIQIFTTLNESDYTVESWASMTSVYDQAVVLFNATSANQNDVNAMTQSLNDAYDSLVPVTVVDKTQLQELVNAYDTYDSSAYTDESWALLTAAYHDSVLLLTAPSATQTQVDAMVLRLRAAFDALVESEPSTVDKSVLAALIVKIDSYDEKAYTPESWAALQSIYAEARIILNDTNASQESVDAMVIKLQQAHDGLKRISIVNPVVPDKTLPTTGVRNQNTMVLLGIFAIIAGSMLWYGMRRYKKED